MEDNCISSPEDTYKMSTMKSVLMVPRRVALSSEHMLVLLFSQWLSSSNSKEKILSIARDVENSKFVHQFVITYKVNLIYFVDIHSHLSQGGLELCYKAEHYLMLQDLPQNL